jgi:putative peptidoglycan lipid II flippase
LGQGIVSDAYNLANTAPNLLFELVLGGVLSSTLVPLFVTSKADDDQRNADERASVVMSLGLLALVALCVVALLTAPLFLDIFSADSGGHSAAREAIASPLLRLLLPQILFYGVTSIGTAILHARRQYAVAAFAPVLTNVVTIAAFVTVGVVTTYAELSGTLAIYLLGLGTTAGVAAMAACVVWGVRNCGIELTWTPNWRHPVVREIARLSGWTVGYVASNQIALLVILSLATNISDGALSAYGMAFIFFQLPHGLLAVSVMTSTTPELSSAAAHDDLDRLRSRFREGFSLVVTLVAPAALAMAIVARAFIEVFLQRGHFDAIDTERTASVLITLAIGLPFFSAYLFTLRVFYARKDTRTPFFLNLAENAINIVLAFFEVGLGVGGLGLAYSLAYLSALVGSLVVAQRRIGGIIDARLLRMFVNAGLAAVGTGLPMAIVIAFVRNVVGVDSPLLELVLAVPLGLMGLLATITAFDIEGFESVTARLRPRARR